MNKHGLFDIYGAVHIPFWQTKAFFYGISASFAIVLVLILFILYKKRKKPAEPAWKLAQQDIELLKKNGLAQASKGKEFYVELTSILKRYLNSRFGYDSIGKTDEELLEYLKKEQFSPILIHLLHEIFSGVTSIKFANAAAAQEQIDRDITRSLGFIKMTIPSDKK